MVLRLLRGALRPGSSLERRRRACRGTSPVPRFVRLEHWREADLRRWRQRWPHFSPRELASHGDGSLVASCRLLDLLEALRAEMGGRPLRVTSCYRDPLHNARIGGAPRSRHKIADAADISIGGCDRHALAAAAVRLGATGIGYYVNFLHVDLRPARPARWYGGSKARQAWAR